MPDHVDAIDKASPVRAVLAVVVNAAPWIVTEVRVPFKTAEVT
jgi:hypothetical protein